MKKHSSWHLHSLLSLVWLKAPSVHSCQIRTPLQNVNAMFLHFIKAPRWLHQAGNLPISWDSHKITSPTRCHMMSHGYISRNHFSHMDFLLLVEEIPNNHLGYIYIYIKPCKWWEIYHINRLAGFFSINSMSPFHIHQPYEPIDFGDLLPSSSHPPVRQDLEGFTVV